ncbi:MAG TPA: hypothetical protein VE988_21690 [Gemmataceae bacterium]|nr:hypothetical protein [Gemmataceae bacterium]
MHKFTAFAALAVLLSVAMLTTAQDQPPQKKIDPKTLPKSDAKGNPIRYANKTGHISNYDESKVKPYKLPELLKMANGELVQDAKMWFEKRRPEILKLFQTEIFGRIPANAPSVKWQVASTDDNAAGGTAIMKKVVGTMSEKAGAPKINLTLYIPAKAKGPVPAIIIIGGGGGGKGGAPGKAGALTGTPGQIIAKGFAYAGFSHTEVQPDQNNTYNKGVIGLCLKPGQTKPDPDEWGSISAWAWATSRVIDYLETDKLIDAKCIGIQGTSRLGRTALWEAAQDERVTTAFPAVCGEAAAAIARRDWGETVDDMAQNYPWQLGGNYQKWVGRWDDMPVDAHMLIALVAPRGLFVNGGTTDQWMDPVGMFQGLVHAGPAYKLVGAKDLGTKDLPPIDKIVMDGNLAWSYHTGGHMATGPEWTAFLEFSDRHFKELKAKKK